MPIFGASRNETGFLRRADVALGGAGVTAEEDEYLQRHFISSRDRVSALATTVGTAGTFLLALLAIVVAVSSSVNTEATKAADAAEASVLLASNCVKDATPADPACTAEKLRQAQAKVDRANARLREVERLSQGQVLTAGFLLLAFLAGLGSQLINPLPPRTTSAQTPAQRTDEWKPVRDRYRAKRNWVVVSLLLDFAAVATLIVAGSDWIT